MLKLLKTIMRAGTATVKYPFAPLEVSPGFRGKPDLMPSQCIACGACACACPANALTIQTDDQQKTVALAAELLAQQQNAPQNREMLRAQASVCPECKQRATLINDDTDVLLVAKEQL